MRLIDADELEKRIKPYDTADTMDKALYNFALHEIVCMPTVDVLEQIRDEIKAEMDDIASGCVAKYSHDEGYYSGLSWALKIIDKYTK